MTGQGRRDTHRASDAVVIGGGVAGLTCALRLAPRRVTLLSKTKFGQGGNSPWAQGGIAAAIAPPDSPGLHARDTIEAGAGLCDPDSVRCLTEGAAAEMRRLIGIGARFDRAGDGGLARGREAAHGRARILHAKDATGAEVMRALAEAVRRAPHVRIEDRAHALDLVTDGRRVLGVIALSDDGRLVQHQAAAVVLATGGVGRLYRHTTNPPEATGDGLAMAARAGAVLADLEFVQFHPTALDVDEDPRPLLTEALRGQGAWLVDEAGRRFVADVHPDGELAPRDVVSRAIWSHQSAGHRVWLDARAAVGDAFPQRFPTVFEVCRRHGLDPRREPMPVTPAAHYHMGGIAVDLRGRSSLGGLWACGEVACTGVHGANRLASNSLLEGLVFGARVAEDVLVAGVGRGAGCAGRGIASIAPLDSRPWGATADEETVAGVRDVTWENVGLVRDAGGLAQAVERLDGLWRLARGPEARNLALVGRLIATAAQARLESRGGHYRSDYAALREVWRHHLFWHVRGDGAIAPVPARALRNLHLTESVA